jgi:hypothetical protein
MSNKINRDMLIGGCTPAFETNAKGKTVEKWVKSPTSGKWHRALNKYNQFGQTIETFSALPEDSWKSLESAVIGEQSVPMSGVQDLMDAGLVIGESPFFVQHEWDVTSEVTAADITVDGEASDDRDQFQTERKAITVPVISKSFRVGFRAMGAYNSTGRSFSTDQAVQAAQVVAEAKENALFNGFGDVKIATASETFGYTNNPDTNSAAGLSWGTPGNATTVVNNIIAAQAADNFDSNITIYASQTQYNEISGTPRSADNNVTELEFIESIPQITAVRSVKPQFLADGSVLGVSLQRNTVVWVEAMPFTIVEWQSDDGMTTHWRVMTIAAPRTTSTFANRAGMCLSTGN